MNESLRKEIIREELKRKYEGRNPIPAKYAMKYPESAEREYLRLANAYMTIEKEILLKYIPELKKIFNDGMKYNIDSKKDNEKNRKLARFSTIDNTLVRIKIIFESIQKEFDAAFGLYNLKHELKKIANLDHKLTVSEWKKAVSKTLGINLLDDYYSGDVYQELIEKWISDNVDLIKTIPAESLKKIKEKVYTNYMNGSSTTNIVKELQRQYSMDKKHARMIGRDQTAKLNSNITQYQQREAGIQKYKWSTSKDERVRKSHKKLDGKIFSWDNPPETDGGRRCHPGEDYQCRCCAIPVFDFNKLDLPV